MLTRTYKTYKRGVKAGMWKKVAIGFTVFLAIMNLPDMIRYAKIEMM